MKRSISAKKTKRKKDSGRKVLIQKKKPQLTTPIKKQGNIYIYCLLYLALLFLLDWKQKLSDDIRKLEEKYHVHLKVI